MIETTPIAKESGHWYLPDGTPYYTVERKDGKGERPTTIRDARKVNAAPSVTAITKQIVGPGLQYYFERQMFEATLRLKRTEGEDDDSLFKRARAESKVHAQERAEEGHKLHGAIEQYMRGEIVQHQRFLPHIENIIQTASAYGVSFSGGDAERSFYHPLGFGGKCDFQDQTNPLVVDFKNKPTIDDGKQYGYDEHVMQLAAYREGFGISTARCMNFFVGIEDQKVRVIEWSEEDILAGWEQFKHLLMVWQIKNKYAP